MREGEAVDAEVAAMRLVGEPVVDRADGFCDEQSDTAELPLLSAFPGDLTDAYDRLITPPGSGAVGWWSRLGAALRGCWPMLSGVAVVSAGPVFLLTGRVADTVVAAPVLSELAGGIGLLLLPLMWLSYLALAALPLVMCLTGVVGVLVAWAPEGRVVGLRTALAAVGRRFGPLWAWLGVLGVIGQLWMLLPPDAPRSLTAAGAMVAAALSAFLGVLGCVVLFERGRGPLRVFRLLAGCPGGTVVGLGTAGCGLVVLPSVAEAAGGTLAGSAVTVLFAVLWAVAALLTYAQARRVEGPLTSGRLWRDLVR